MRKRYDLSNLHHSEKHDFHTLIFLNRGVLSPAKLICRAIHNGYLVMAVTGYVGPDNWGPAIGAL